MERISTRCEIVDAAKEAGITAVIASDVAVTYCNRIGVEVHLSTQLNISNIEALRFYAQFADVVVLAYELNMDQVAGIYRQIVEQNICGPRRRLIRIEMFCHDCALHGHLRQVLHESAQCQPLCQPWRMRADLPPLIYRYGQ